MVPSDIARKSYHIGLVLISMISVLSLAQGGDSKSKTKKSASVKPSAKKDSSTRVATELERIFKAWDLDKDGSVTRDELLKFYRTLTAKSKKKAGAGAPINNQDLPEPVQALYESLDSDQDQQISSAEFSAWAQGFADYHAKATQLQEEMIVTQRQIAEVQQVMGVGGRTTAAQGAANSQLRQGVGYLELKLKRLESQLQKLETDGGHVKYREFLQQELSRRAKP